MAVDTSLLDDAASRVDAIDLSLALGLMVERHRNSSAALAHHAPRVTCISDPHFPLAVVDHNHVCSASNRVKVEIVLRLGSISPDSFLLLLAGDVGEDFHERRLGGRVIALGLGHFLEAATVQLHVHFQEPFP